MNASTSLDVSATIATITALREQQESWESVFLRVSQLHPWRPWTSAEQVRSWYRRASARFSLPRASVDTTPAETTLTLAGTTLVFADIHVPYHHETMIEQAVVRWSPDHILLAGDVFDFDELSSFPRDHRTVLLEEELAYAGDLLHSLSSVASVTVFMGNHERRLLNVLETPLSFQRLISLTGIPSGTVTALQREYVFIGDTLLIGHGWSSAAAGVEAAKLALRYQRHVLLGHNHQCGARIARGLLPNQAWMGVSIGCSCYFERLWYHARRAHSRWYQRGYAVLFPDGTFLICDEHHNVVAGVWNMFGSQRFVLP